MERFFKYLMFFSIAHLFFSVFMFFGIGIIVDTPDRSSTFSFLYVMALAAIATVTQSLIFTVLSRYFEMDGVPFFISGILIELVLCNLMVYYFISAGSSNEFPAIMLMNVCLVVALSISLMIQQYSLESYTWK